MKRGEIVLVVASGDYGKPRPAVIVQSNLFNETHGSITVCPITSQVIDAPMFRVTVEATKLTGLKKSSQIMVDKIQTLRSDRIKSKVGILDPHKIRLLDEAIKLWLSL